MHRSLELASGVVSVGVASPESAEATVEEQHLPLDLLKRKGVTALKEQCWGVQRQMEPLSLKGQPHWGPQRGPPW